jgi:hypothetical protein
MFTLREHREKLNRWVAEQIISQLKRANRRASSIYTASRATVTAHRPT